MRNTVRSLLPALFVLTLTAATGCAPQESSPPSGAGSGTGSGTGSGASGSTAAESCDPGALPTEAKGKLTVGTDKPAYAPWFQDDDPANGKGFESAVAYAVAEALGYAKDQVVWRTVPFNNSVAPGEKSFDFDINQVSISDARKKAVDFSAGYYDVRPAVVALKKSPYAKARTIADLKGARLGAQVGSTSLDLIDATIEPKQRPAVFQKNDFAKSALRNGQVDAIVVDLPTAFYITSAEVTDAEVVGQFVQTPGAAEQFGLVLDKDSRLTPCVTRAVEGLRADGTLAALEKTWLTDAVDVPVLK
ncbi:ABC transporter substrate-binding protein [Streptomyces sp. NPDC093109]|uniref:ABC transporter substrate-binding protein n=1 Tax=Streptomyces sp. NPDC093109 TaxID=3154977 RepID=UPI0034504F21